MLSLCEVPSGSVESGGCLECDFGEQQEGRRAWMGVVVVDGGVGDDEQVVQSLLGAGAHVVPA